MGAIKSQASCGFHEVKKRNDKNSNKNLRLQKVSGPLSIREKLPLGSSNVRFNNIGQPVLYLNSR